MVQIWDSMKFHSSTPRSIVNGENETVAGASHRDGWGPGRLGALTRAEECREKNESSEAGRQSEQ